MSKNDLVSDSVAAATTETRVVATKRLNMLQANCITTFEGTQTSGNVAVLSSREWFQRPRHVVMKWCIEANMFQADSLFRQTFSEET
jgi:hypothetical protein